MARSDFLHFATRALRAQRYAPAKHHRLLAEKLNRVRTGDCRRLMVFMPPGSAKSTYASKLFPAFFMQDGRKNIIGASNTAELAVNMSREVMGYVREEHYTLGYEIARESAENWSTTNGCQYRAAGVGGTITGFRSDLGIIDDPVRSRKDVESKGNRDDTWNWFNADFMTRLKPHGAVILIQTRWHEDDLGGRLLESQPHLWEVVNIPATAGDDDILGRAPGEMLWSDDEYGYGARILAMKNEYEINGAMRDWYALFEQDPRPLSGGLFNVDKIRIVDEAPKCKRILRGWDLAASENVGTRNPDWTVGVKMGVTEDDRYVVLDVFRDRGGPADVDNWLKAVGEMDGRAVRISIPQDPGGSGKSQAHYHIKLMAGFAITATPETGNKATRAAPFAAQMNAGHVMVVKGLWNNAYIEELRGFPSAAKDDQVDASSRAFNSLVAGGTGRIQKIGY